MGKARNEDDYRERVDRKRKSWVSSERSMSVGSGVARMVESSSMSAIVACGGNQVGATKKTRFLLRTSLKSRTTAESP